MAAQHMNVTSKGQIFQKYVLVAQDAATQQLPEEWKRPGHVSPVLDSARRKPRVPEQLYVT